MKRRLSKSKVQSVIAAMIAACGAAPQVVIEPDGTIRITPAGSAEGKAPTVDRPKPVSL